MSDFVLGSYVLCSKPKTKSDSTHGRSRRACVDHLVAENGDECVATDAEPLFRNGR